MVWKRSGDPLGGPELIMRPFRRDGTGRDTLPMVWNWLGDLIGGQELVGRPSWRSGSGLVTLPEVRKWSQSSSEV